MTSDTAYQEAYVWIWLPGRTEPVVAGLSETDRLLLRGRQFFSPFAFEGVEGEF